jgi:hypothetical protein
VQNGKRHRIEWLIDALTNENVDVAQAAGEELVEITRQDFGYSAQLGKKERDKSVARYRDWWSTEGRYRFAR